MHPIWARSRALLVTVGMAATMLFTFAGGALATEDPGATNAELVIGAGGGGGSAAAGEAGFGDSPDSGILVAQTGDVGLDPLP